MLTVRAVAKAERDHSDACQALPNTAAKTFILKLLVCAFFFFLFGEGGEDEGRLGRSKYFQRRIEGCKGVYKMSHGMSIYVVKYWKLYTGGVSIYI